MAHLAFSGGAQEAVRPPRQTTSTTAIALTSDRSSRQSGALRIVGVRRRPHRSEEPGGPLGGCSGGPQCRSPETGKTDCVRVSSSFLFVGAPAIVLP